MLSVRVRIICGYFCWMSLSIPLVSLDASAQTQSIPLGSPAEMVAERVLPSVAVVMKGETTEGLTATGTALIIRSDGVLFTAYDLVRGNAKIRVQLANGEVYDQPELLAFDERRNVAALRVRSSGLHALRFAEAEAVKPGDVVFAIYNYRGSGWNMSGTEVTRNCVLEKQRRTERVQQYI